MARSGKKLVKKLYDYEHYKKTASESLLIVQKDVEELTVFFGEKYRTLTTDELRRSMFLSIKNVRRLCCIMNQIDKMSELKK